VLLGQDAPVLVFDRVCETAEGNPLYLEQLTAMLADQGYLVGGRWIGPQDPNVEIPTTLQALLTARLDRLDPATRQMLGRASIEGRRFRMPALSALAAELPSAAIEEAVAELDRRGLVEPEDEAVGQWRFAHALVREAAYRGVSKELRAELHEALAMGSPADASKAVRVYRGCRGAPPRRFEPANSGGVRSAGCKEEALDVLTGLFGKITN
jgi:predicted ATPase